MQGKQALKGLIIAPLISDIIKFEFFNYITHFSSPKVISCNIFLSALISKPQELVILR